MDFYISLVMIHAEKSNLQLLLRYLKGEWSYQRSFSCSAGDEREFQKVLYFVRCRSLKSKLAGTICLIDDNIVGILKSKDLTAQITIICITQDILIGYIRQETINLQWCLTVIAFRSAISSYNKQKLNMTRGTIFLQPLFVVPGWTFSWTVPWNHRQHLVLLKHTTYH